MLLAKIGDTSYDIMLLLHLLAAVVGFAPAWLWPLMVRMTAGGSADAADAIEASIVRFSLPGSIVAGLLGFGLAGMSDKVYSMSQAWLMVASLLWLILIAVYAFIARPAIAKFRAGDDSARGLMGAATGVSHLILLVMLYLMIFKPGLGV